MADFESLKRMADELVSRVWETQEIEARITRLARYGFPEKTLARKELTVNKQLIADRVRQRAEEYNFMLKNCAQSTALALMEEFGLGDMKIIKALTPFPGIGGTGETCGAITGSLIAFGLFFGSDKPPNFTKTNQAIAISQEYIVRFINNIGYSRCSDIIDRVILGHSLNPGESESAMNSFTREKGFERCCLLPGIGASLATALIIDSL